MAARARDPQGLRRWIGARDERWRCKTSTESEGKVPQKSQRRRSHGVRGKRAAPVRRRHGVSRSGGRRDKGQGSEEGESQGRTHVLILGLLVVGRQLPPALGHCGGVERAKIELHSPRSSKVTYPRSRDWVGLRSPPHPTPRRRAPRRRSPSSYPPLSSSRPPALPLYQLVPLPPPFCLNSPSPIAPLTPPVPARTPVPLRGPAPAFSMAALAGPSMSLLSGSGVSAMPLRCAPLPPFASRRSMVNRNRGPPKKGSRTEAAG